jgi:hypothetical protein
VPRCRRRVLSEKPMNVPSVPAFQPGITLQERRIPALRCQREIQDVHGHHSIVHVIKDPGIGQLHPAWITEFIHPDVHSEILESRRRAARLPAQVLLAQAVAEPRQRHRFAVANEEPRVGVLLGNDSGTFQSALTFGTGDQTDSAPSTHKHWWWRMAVRSTRVTATYCGDSNIAKSSASAVQTVQ